MPILPDLSKSYTVTEQQKHSYREEGHILLKNVASLEEMNVYEPIIREEYRRILAKSEPVPLEYSILYGEQFLNFIDTSNMWEKNDQVKKFVLAERFSKIAADLMGVHQVRLHHDAVLFKEPGAGRTHLHQDQKIWPLDTDKTITLWMPLTDLTLEVGSLTFFTGTQHWGDMGISVDKMAVKALKEGVPQINYGAMKAGDATFHNGWILHYAPPNPSKMTREVITIVYYADGARITDTRNNKLRQGNLLRYFPELAPGDLAASKLNPVVFSTSNLEVERYDA